MTSSEAIQPAMAPTRALLIEDDQSVREAVAIAFQELGFRVEARATGEGVAVLMTDFRPDVAIIDIQLPSGPDGYQVARQVIALGGVPVVFLTASDGLEDRLAGFEAGGDDYIVKPFAMSELLARVRAVLRRSGRLQSPVLEIRDLLIDDNAKQAMRGGVLLDLTPTEFELLAVLARAPNQVFSKGQLLSQIWGFDSYDPNLVEVHVSALRRKLDTRGPRLVHTVRSRGYVFRP